MYFAVVKLTFEAEAGDRDPRDLHNLVEKIRSRFKVCAAACEGEGAPAVAITALASTMPRLSQTMDAITEFCEQSGFGRLEDEEALMDHIDAVAEIGTDAE